MGTTNIIVSDAALAAAAEEGMIEFLQVFTDRYIEVLGGELTAENMNMLNGEQHALLSYRYFRDEIMHGGFIQLIQNGYGSYIFDNPFAKAMRLFGAEDFSKLIYKAKKIYDSNKVELEKECNEDEFMSMYERFPQFDELEEDFFEMDDDIANNLAVYVDDHLDLFAQISE